jgi:alpha-ribazole phosphatase
MPPVPDTQIDFIRHGEPVGGRAFRGHHIDDPLSDKGWAQMWAAVGEQCPWTQVVSSPLSRCRAFAEALAERHGIAVAVEERLKEVGFGSWEGRSPAQVQRENPDEYVAFYTDPLHSRPPGAEPLLDFFARVRRAFEDITSSYAGGHVLVVAHAGVIRGAIAHVLQAAPQAAYRVKVQNAGLTRFRCGAQGCVLEFHGRDSL